MSARERFLQPYKKMFHSPLQLRWDLTMSPKRTISASGGLGLLQMVSEHCEIPHRLERGTKHSL